MCDGHRGQPHASSTRVASTMSKQDFTFWENTTAPSLRTGSYHARRPASLAASAIRHPCPLRAS